MSIFDGINGITLYRCRCGDCGFKLKDCNICVGKGSKVNLIHDLRRKIYCSYFRTKNELKGEGLGWWAIRECKRCSEIGQIYVNKSKNIYYCLNCELKKFKKI